MAIAAKFEADFSQFSAAVQKGTADVVKLKAETSTMGKAFAEMDADRHFVSLSEASGKATNSIGQFRNGLAQVDRSLSQVGLNLTPQVAALAEMSLIAGKTAAQLGAVATAGAVLTAALAGWKLGGMIASFTSLDEWLGKTIATMLGYSDKAELAAHQTDVMARASKIAGVEVTSFSVAVGILAQASKDLAASLPGNVFDKWRADAAAAQREFRGLDDAQRKNIETYLALGKSATQIDQAMHLQAGTVQVLIDRNKLLAEQDKINIDSTNKRVDAINKLIGAQQKFIELAPLQPKDVTLPEFKPTGAFATILSEETGKREQTEAEALAAEQMEANRLLLEEMAKGHQKVGETAKAATDIAQGGYVSLGNAIGGATQQAERFAVSQRQLMDLGEAQRQFNAGGNRATTTQEALLRGFEISTARGGAPGGAGAAVINIDASGAFFDSPDGMNRLATKVSDALMLQRRSVGGTA